MFSAVKIESTKDGLTTKDIPQIKKNNLSVKGTQQNTNNFDNNTTKNR